MEREQKEQVEVSLLQSPSAKATLEGDLDSIAAVTKRGTTPCDGYIREDSPCAPCDRGMDSEFLQVGTMTGVHVTSNTFTHRRENEIIKPSL